MRKAMNLSPLFLGLALLTPGAVSAQQATALAPIPVAITSAHTIFVAQGGADGVAARAFEGAKQINEPYNSAYLALKTWGRYELVSSPRDADLVLEVSFTAPISECTKGTAFEPQLSLKILDAHTHFLVWNIVQPVKPAFLKGTWEKNYASAIADMVSQMKALATQPAP
jgi:hypothetical protein